MQFALVSIGNSSATGPEEEGVLPASQFVESDQPRVPPAAAPVHLNDDTVASAEGASTSPITMSAHSATDVPIFP